MPVFEPVVFFDSLLDSLKQMQLQEASLAQRVASLEQRRRATASKDAPGWIAIYEETLALLPLALRAYKEQQQQRAKAQEEAAARAAAAQRINQLAPLVSQALQWEQGTWNGRLTQQLQQIQEKAERSLLNLDLAARDLPETGETRFEIEPRQLEDFWSWLKHAEQTWRENNEQLVAERSNEELKKVGLPAEIPFEIKPAKIPDGTSQLPPLKGYKILTPSKLEVLGTTQKILTASLGGVTVLSMAASRIAGSAANTALPVVFGLVFAGALVYAVTTVPTKFKQAMARQKESARQHVHQELLGAVKTRLTSFSSLQTSAIQRHIRDEETRWTQLVRQLGGGHLPGVGAPPAMAPMGVPPATLAKMEGPWPTEIQARIAQLQGA
ncbi:MAG: hypothetical protein NZX77_21010 [Polyangiaceae bacterium]|nr:hypothetical protein [Polyangiaceae bacterium]